MFAITTPIKRNAIKIQGHVWLRLLHICQNYSFITTIMAWSSFKKLKNLSQNAQNRRSGEKENSHIWKIYKYSHATRASYLRQIIWHWKFVLKCCAKCTSINLPDQETDDQYPKNSDLIRFYIYHLIARCTKHGRLLLTDKKGCRKCQQDTDSGQKKYTLENS